ncbi:hypothetical protein BU26DRAFT_513463 [Trematosphaeria pertusa]|uniref:Small EDRK-rich factor-like N-terminal domain-containing protein n=1 Tax=Trematosphaeria pertusa TaxID=390896 RepID=A0A6A6J267_9PLEO|nr:uncharacterized protein BU26DRAFT_513463 [Trematosphaeria pertusa]KAF2256658.1 hypothetical protein BU26DRAFT_513463 [Trematosphaeria pertusa]
MARGNQREKAREKNLKEQAGKVRRVRFSPLSLIPTATPPYPTSSSLISLSDSLTERFPEK